MKTSAEFGGFYHFYHSDIIENYIEVLEYDGYIVQNTIMKT